jgi:hypothetical protein
MNATPACPSFDSSLAGLNQFILELVEAYRAGKVTSWNELEITVNVYFTPERMAYMESRVPGWRKMASYMEGTTLVHVMCVFLGLFIMPEFLSMTKEQQQVMKWVILFHDIEKESQKGKRDHGHAFRSAVAAARILPGLGFPVTAEYDKLIEAWSEFTRSALTRSESLQDFIQDHRKLPEIIDGIERMFGPDAPAALIVKTILFHLSIDMQPWPPVTPLTDEEVGLYLDGELVLLLRAMNLGDSDGWNMFSPDREKLRDATLEAFKKVRRLVSN